MTLYLLRACVLAAGACGAAAALADHASPAVARFSGAIGSQPFASVGGVPAPNDVLGIAPGGRPWALRKLSARVDANGMLRAKGAGLLLGGGNNIGRPALPRNIQATLFCTVAGAPAAWNSPAVAVDAQGDFSILGTLTPVAPNAAVLPPMPCESPILLIRNSTAATTPGGQPTPGAWFAAGIPGGDHDD